MWQKRQATLPLFPGEGISGAGRAVAWPPPVIHLVAGNMEGHRDTTPSYTVLHSQTKEFLFHLYTYFLKEKANGGPLIPISQARKRAAQASNTSEATVKRHCSGAKKKCDTEPEYKPVFSSPKLYMDIFLPVFFGYEVR